MKCLNANCPNPSVVESFPVQSLRFCPICGFSLDTTPKSSENNQNTKNPSQTKEEGAEQPSLAQHNWTTVYYRSTPKTSSSPSSELNGRDEEPAGSASDGGDTGKQDQADVHDDNTSSGILEGTSAGSAGDGAYTGKQDQADVHDDNTSSGILEGTSAGSASDGGDTGKKDQADVHDDNTSSGTLEGTSAGSASDGGDTGKKDQADVHDDNTSSGILEGTSAGSASDGGDTGKKDQADVHDDNTSSGTLEGTSAGSASDGGDTGKKDQADVHDDNTSSGILEGTSAGSASDGGDTGKKDQADVHDDNTSPLGNQNQMMNNKDEDKTKTTAVNEARKAITTTWKSSGSNVDDSNQHQGGYFYRKPPLDEQHSNKGKAKNADSNSNKAIQQSPQASSNKTSGSGVSESITIVFHALLAPHFMFDPRYGEKIFLCGGFPFKGWNENQLEMSPKRWLHNGYLVIEGVTQIPLKCAGHRFTYKYKVLKQEERKFKYVWEELVGYPNYHGMHTNRCFYIPERYRKPKATWHQYDDGIFRPPGPWESFLSNFPMYKFVNPVEARQLAMQVMLPDWDSFGEENRAGKKKGSEVLETINQVVYCIGNVKRETGGQVYDHKLKDFSLEQVMLLYIEPRLNLNYELAQATNNVEVQAKRLATSLAIAAMASNFVQRLAFRPEDEHLVKMFECLAINSSLDQQRLEIVLDILMNGYYSPDKTWRLLEGILELCQFTITHRPHINEWLLAIPLMHFLSKSCQPYTEVTPITETPSTSDGSYWGTNSLDLSNVQKHLSSSPIEVLHRLKAMFEFDPLLRRTFLFALPLRDFGRCVRRGDFPPDEICWTLGARLKTTAASCIFDEEVSSINECLSAIIETIDRETEAKNETENPTTSFDLNRYISLGKASQQVLDFFLKSFMKDTLALACAVLTMLAKTLSLMKYIATKPQFDELINHDDINNFCSESIAAMTKKVRNCLEKVFTRNLGSSSQYEVDAELKTWSAFYHVEFSDITLRQSWEEELKESLNLRIKKMNEMQRIEFYSKVKFTNFHHQVGECFQAAAFDAITSIIKVGREAEHEKAFNSLRSSESKGVGDMLSLLLERCWPENTKQQHDLLTHVLTWNPMANYLRYFSERSQTLSENSQCLLTRTTSCLEDVYRKVSNASVKVNILGILRGKEEKYCELIDIIKNSIDESDDDSDEESEEDDEQDDNHEGIGRIYRKAQATLQKRLNELAAFEEEREQLRSFLGISSILQHVDVDDMKTKANVDVSQYAIDDLAVHTHERDDQAQVQVTFFGFSKELKTMITTMYCIHNSRIFTDIWRKRFQNAQQEDEEDMTLEKVVEQVWCPTLKKCKDILQAVLTGNITLEDIDKRFEDFKGRSAEPEQDLGVIMRACHGTIDAKLLHTQVDQIKQYHRLTNCIAAADKILEFAEKMDLTGDFGMVETFRRQISPESKRQSLKSLREEFNTTGRTLEEFTPDRLKCLDAVATSKDFIVWLKDKVSDPSEIKVLVDLAMMSAGEGDMESDRIAALHTCTRGFKPLIYDLKHADGFDHLVKLCQDVWDELKHNPRLPVQMTDTSQRLEWLKNVVEFHGSVTMSSLQQVETITKHATLTIGCHGNSEEININVVIRLRVPPEKVKGLQKENYSLEDLKDLQSKLMLIAGKDAGKEDVDKFTEMLQSAIRLGTVYLTLCETGEVSHLDWKEDFDCRGKDVILQLNNYHDEFDNLLKAWTEILSCQRTKCNELNYFTAKQLLYMRKEIAELRRGREFTSLDVQLYTLLDSVLPGVSARSLQEALIAIDIDVDFPEENQLSLETDEEEKNPDGDLRKRYETFFDHIKELSFPEEVALAAIVACDCPHEEADLLMWCLQNKDKEDDIQELCDEGAQNPKYASLFPQESVPDVTRDDEQEKMDIERPIDDERNFASELDQTSGGLYLSLQELSTLLACLATHPTQEDQKTMTFPDYLKAGKPNLLLVPQRDILPTVLGLYMESEAGLPSRHEVLICTQDTTLEEVRLLWRRVLSDTSDKFYCLVNADLLSYNISQQAVQSFYELAEREYPDSYEYKVVVICSNEQEVKSHIVSALDEYRVTAAPRCPRPSEVTQYLHKQFVAPRPGTVVYQDQRIHWVPAAHVESRDRLSVRVISSDRAGTGKSLIVKDYSKRLDSITSNSAVTTLLEEQEEHVTSYVIVPLHGKTANLSDTVSVLLPYSLKTDVPMSRIFHIDVSPSVEDGLDTLLFNLLLLGSIQDNRGRVWKRNPRDLYIVEVTSSHDTQHTESTDKYARTRYFYNELPHVTCVTPEKALRDMEKDTAADSCMTSFNEGQFQSKPVQRVYQYLRLYDTAPEILHEFQFDPEELAEGGANCLCLLMRYCGVADPSWAELRHFVDFLNYQLTDCEQSVFCQMENVADTLEGFRLFVVRFMTLMAQDFSTRSLSDPVNDDDDTHDDEPQDIVQFQLRRRWESSPHPYMFFNPDHQTFTFLGFRLDPDGNLINCSTGEMIQEQLMTRHLRTGLYVQKVNFDEDFEQLHKGEKIQKICTVLGVQWPRDPDESYELTEDNAKKMLAIHMRFRCGIPVVVMGETGCGKTKLIRYLCGLQKGFDERKNMLLVKVHGGTTFQDIEKKVKQAQQMAKENSKNNVETILFFDEVNTTEALDLVKEIMVDHRLNGRPLGSEDDRLRFIAACNPYRKHTDTMIKKLESAGLGYSVKTGDTTERIGCVPLRHLVYRVHALPDSMRSLIWDFGQLKPGVEQLYTRQIVMRHVIKEGRIPGDERLVDAITAVLAASQQYMREQSDECSFVSLRDVERTMNVMVWFYEHQDVFRPFLEEIAKEEDEHTNGRSDDDDSDNDDDEQKEEDDESDSDGLVKEEETDDEEETTIREDEKPRVVFRSPFSKFDADESKPIPSRSGIFIPPSFSGDGRPFVPFQCYEDGDEDFGADEIQEPMFIHEEEDLDDPTKPLDPVTWSLILAIGVCYHAKLQDRQQYRHEIAKTFKRPCVLYGGAERILQEITRCQKAVLKELDPGPNIARNTALSENVFMMVVCIELRIPLFVIGKPGSSKSLAKTVVADNMQGDASKSQLFKSFKEVQMSSHQCSPLSTPEGIQETFRQSANIQKDKKTEKFVSAVVLDEVGLAEDSPLMPLKTLHPLLEDGVTSSDDIIEVDEKPTRVAFIGLSNWALDPAKMNRGIMMSRDVPDERELEDSAMGICASNEEVQELMKPIIPELAAAYSELYQQQKEIEVLTDANKDEFFGLRDFYSLIKMLRVIAEKKEHVPDWRDVEYAVRRNFGGLDGGEMNPVEIFMKHLGVDDHVRREEKHQTRDVSPLQLIKSSLEKDSSEQNSRYLLILTENHAALGIVEQHLKLHAQNPDDLEAVLIFGSSFPKDLEYTQVCRNINDIKVCMETGRIVILLNMESLYEGLYDALNQYYVYFGGNRYVDLGLGTHRVKCRVHNDFRLIVIAEKDTVYKKFPIPLINRLEKHFLVLSTSLTNPQEKMVKILKEWVGRFSSIEMPIYRRHKKKFTEDDAFVGYHDDTIPSVVLQVCSQLHQDGTTKDEWEEQVLLGCKRRLVQCCPPDAIVRLHYSKLQHEADELWHLYFKEQQHSSLASFVSNVDRRHHRDGLLIQVSTHSKLLSEQNLTEIGGALNLYPKAISCITLQQFQTEQQFCDSVGNFFAKQGGRECLLIVQCNTEDLTFNLLACARHHLLKQRSKIQEEIQEVEPTHIIVIIQLPKMFGRYPNFVGFQGQRWESVHIDELFAPSFYVPSLENVKDHSLSELFEESIDMYLSRTDEEEQGLDAVDVLRQSVQAAAGRIEDGPGTVARATKRIVILLSLLSKDRNEDSFSHVVLRRVHHLLKEKDASAPHEGVDWSRSEALESSELQESGTYGKALWRRIQNAVVPILSEVIAYMDKDGNLELLQTDEPWIKKLWLKIFADDKLAQLHYDSFLTNDDERQLKSHVCVTSSGRDAHWFQCRLPFSWLLKENIDSMWQQAKTVSENSEEFIQDCFQRFVENSDIQEEINLIEEHKDAMERYIHDFVHMNCKPVEPGEDELIARALVVEARHQHNLSASREDDFEFPDIALVHKAYYHIEHRIACFSQLVQCIPSIVPKLLEVFTPDEREMILDVMALRMCLESLEPLEVSFKDSDERRKWCDDVIAVRATAERIFTDKHQLEEEDKRIGILGCCRPLWERLTAIRLFIEHVYLSKKKSRNPENIIKLCRVLDDQTDFSSASSIETVELFLVECIDSFKKSSAQAVNVFRHHCNSFFMELISLLCFGGEAHRKSLDPEVFEIFMRYITGSSSSQATKNFSPFPDFEVDTTPIVRSFLLQQLLTISSNEVKKYLQRYLSNAQALSPDRHHVMRVCQLVVDCIEDSTSSTLSQRELPLYLAIGLATSMITKGSDALHKVRYSDTLGIEGLEAIARVRHVLALTAELLFKSHVAGDEKLQDSKVKPELDKLQLVVQGMCEEMPHRAPLVYLLKQLTRRYGASVIKDLTQDPQMSWLIPREFQERQIDTSSDPDRFVVYSDEYTSVRDALARGLLSGSVDELSTLTQVDGSDMMNSTTKMDILCLLSIYREVTCGYREPRHQLQEYAELRKFFDENLSPEARPLVIQLLDNSHGMGFTALSVQPAQPRATINLADLVVHTMVVLQCSNDSDVMSTLRSLLINPGHMKDSFIPTMPEDDFQQVRMGLTETGKWHVCPQGHRYFIGDCGGATQESVCSVCKSGIGGKAYKLVAGNALLTDQNEDQSNRGHILGNANMDQVSSAVQPERNLSPAVVHLIRLVMHSAMLVGACRQPQESSQIFSPPVEAERLPQFLWAHLTHDLRCLAAALNRNEDEALLTVHLVLAQITRVTTHDYVLNPGSGVLNSSSARRQWEENFTSRFIEPVLSTLDERIQTCFDTMTNDSRIGTDPLMREIYEVDNSEREQEEDEEEELSHMKRCFWRYRPSITVEHAKQRFSEKMKSDKRIQCKVLQHFFKQEYRLRVVRYLPNIIKLHKLLTDRFYRRINQKHASEMTVKEFKAKLKDSEKKEFKALFGSFKDAWTMVRDRLDKPGRYRLSSEKCRQAIDDNSPMSILIPSSDGLGRCSLALVFYIVTAHNEFMETYLNIIMGKASQDNKIRLPEVTSSQLVSYDSDRDLLPLIQAHCHYSLEVGHGTLVEYDWTAIQRQLIDRFIRGKQLVEFEEPKFVFLRNNDEEMFTDVRTKIEQEHISPISVGIIMAELHHLNEVCEVKLSLEIAMGFLASSGGRPDQSIREYLQDVLRMPSEKGLRSQRAEQHCQLKHIVHLWQLVTTKRAKILLKDDQDPFDEVQECFKDEIPRDVLFRLNRFLRTIDCSRFCGELLEMIIFSLNEENEKNVDICLQEIFEWHMDEREATDVSGLPDELLLKHSVKTWENVLDKSEDHYSSSR